MKHAKGALVPNPKPERFGLHDRAAVAMQSSLAPLYEDPVVVCFIGPSVFASEDCQRMYQIPNLAQAFRPDRVSAGIRELTCEAFAG
jgi:hypothetical protein